MRQKGGQKTLSVPTAVVQVDTLGYLCHCQDRLLGQESNGRGDSVTRQPYDHQANTTNPASERLGQVMNQLTGVQEGDSLIRLSVCAVGPVGPAGQGQQGEQGSQGKRRIYTAQDGATLLRYPS